MTKLLAAPIIINSEWLCNHIKKQCDYSMIQVSSSRFTTDKYGEVTVTMNVYNNIEDFVETIKIWRKKDADIYFYEACMAPIQRTSLGIVWIVKILLASKNL